MTIQEITALIANFKRAITEEKEGKHTSKDDNIAIYEARAKELDTELAAMLKAEKAEKAEKENLVAITA